MRILTDKNIESLKTRGYINHSFQPRENNFDILNNLSKYNIPPTPYLLLFNGLEELGINNLFRYICLSWKKVAESLGDISIEFNKTTPKEVCNFFLQENKNHRVCFFVEIVYQYFFP
jgi:hypothetical protein|tara:strand:- start:11432 stop:11782 length:351 start_codon:yes stop_codon:yes gene_type:complete